MYFYLSACVWPCLHVCACACMLSYHIFAFFIIILHETLCHKPTLIQYHLIFSLRGFLLAPFLLFTFSCHVHDCTFLRSPLAYSFSIDIKFSFCFSLSIYFGIHYSCKFKWESVRTGLYAMLPEFHIPLLQLV